MLKKNKLVSLSGESIVENQTVARYSAQITTSDSGTTSISTIVNDYVLYRKHLDEVRKDADDFRSYVREVEDELYSSTDNKETTK